MRIRTRDYHFARNEEASDLPRRVPSGGNNRHFDRRPDLRNHHPQQRKKDDFVGDLRNFVKKNPQKKNVVGSAFKPDK